MAPLAPVPNKEAMQLAPAPWEATTSGLDTTPRPAMTPARRRLIDPSQVTEVGGGYQ